MARCKKCKREFPDGSQGAWRNDDPNLICGNCLPSKEELEIGRGEE